MNLFMKSFVCFSLFTLLVFGGGLYAGNDGFSAREMCPECRGSARSKGGASGKVRGAGQDVSAVSDQGVRQKKSGRVVNSKFSAREMCPECRGSARSKRGEPAKPGTDQGVSRAASNRSARQKRRGRSVPIPSNIFRAIGRGDKVTLDQIFRRFPSAINRRQKGMTPLQYAMETNNQEMVGFLKQKATVLSSSEKSSSSSKSSTPPVSVQTDAGCGSLKDCQNKGGTKEELQGLLQTVNQLQMDETPREEDFQAVEDTLNNLHTYIVKGINIPEHVLDDILGRTDFDRSLYHALFEIMRFIKYDDKNANYYTNLLKKLKNKKVGVQKNQMRDFLTHKLSGSLDKLMDNAYLLEFYEDMYGPAPNLRRRILSHISKGMQSEDWRLRRQAIKVAGDMGGSEVVPLLEEALKDEQPYYVRMAGMKALSEMAGKTKLNRSSGGKHRFERQVSFCTSGSCDRDKLWALIERELGKKSNYAPRWCYHVGCSEEGDIKDQVLRAAGRLGGDKAYDVIQKVLDNQGGILSGLHYWQKQNIKIAGLKATAELGGLKAFKILKPYIDNHDFGRDLADVAMEGMALIDHPWAGEMIRWGKSLQYNNRLPGAARRAEGRKKNIQGRLYHSSIRVGALTGNKKALGHRYSKPGDFHPERSWYKDWNNSLDEARLHVLMKAQKKGGQEAISQALDGFYEEYPKERSTRSLLDINLSQLGGREAFEEYMARDPSLKTGSSNINFIHSAYHIAIRTPDEDIVPVVTKWLSEEDDIAYSFREIIFQKLQQSSQTDQLVSFLHKGLKHSDQDVRSHSTYSLMRLGGDFGQSLSRQRIKDEVAGRKGKGDIPVRRFLLSMKNVAAAERPEDLKLLQDGYVNILARPGGSQSAETGTSVLTAMGKTGSPQQKDAFIDELSQHNNFKVRRSFVVSLVDMLSSEQESSISKDQAFRVLSNSLEHADVLSSSANDQGKWPGTYIKNTAQKLYERNLISEENFNSFKEKVKSKQESWVRTHRARRQAMREKRREARRQRQLGRRRRNAERRQASHRVSVEEHQKAMEQKRASEVLDQFLNSEGDEQTVGIQQIQAAGQVGGQKGLKVIEQALGSDRRLLKVAAVAALQEVGSKEAKTVLKQIVEEEGGDVFVKSEAEEALKNMK